MYESTPTSYADERIARRRTPASMIAAGVSALALSAALLFSTPAQALADNAPHPENTPLIAAQVEASLTTQPYDESAANAEPGVLVNSLLSGLIQPDTIDRINNFALEANKAAKQRERNQRVDAVRAEAYKHEGAPYVYGGTTPAGFDCSGFTSYVYRTALGIELPRTAAAQGAMGTSVPMDSLQRGDLLFWGSGSGVYHVGIYVGEGNYIHAAGSGKGVRVQSMEWFTPTFAKRII